MPDAPVSFPRVVFQRLRRKLISIAPVVLAAVAIFLVAWLLLYLVTPFLPQDWQDVLELLNRGDWHEARDQLRVILESSEMPIEIPFVLVQALQVIVAPIPGQLAGLLGGYLFGFWYGLFLTMVGLTIGSWIAMLLGRLFGVQIVRRFVPTDTMAQMDDLIARGGLWNFLVIFILPGLPDDAVCFVAGLTRLSIWKLMVIMFIGRLPGMAVLCFVGSSAGEGASEGYVVFAIAMVASFVLWLFSEELEAWVFGGEKKNNDPV